MLCLPLDLLFGHLASLLFNRLVFSKTRLANVKKVFTLCIEARQSSKCFSSRAASRIACLKHVILVILFFSSTPPSTVSVSRSPRPWAASSSGPVRPASQRYAPVLGGCFSSPRPRATPP